MEQRDAQQRERVVQLTTRIGDALALDCADSAADGSLSGAAKRCTLRPRGAAQLSAKLLRDEPERPEQMRGLEWQRGTRHWRSKQRGPKKRTAAAAC